MNDQFTELVEKVDGSAFFGTSICFRFWDSMSRIGIEYTGWKLTAYWRDRGYDV